MKSFLGISANEIEHSIREQQGKRQLHPIVEKLPPTMRQVVSIVESLPMKGGGVTQVSLIRAQELKRRGLISRIATRAYNTKLGVNYKSFLQRGLLDSEVQIFNFYIWFAMLSMGINPHSVKNTESHVQWH